MKPQNHVCGAFNAIFNQYVENFSSSIAVAFVAPPASIRIRNNAHSFSSSVKNFAAAGVSGMKKAQMIPKTTVMAPSTMHLSALSSTPITSFNTHRRKSMATDYTRPH